MEGILHKRRAVGVIVKAAVVSLVFGEYPLRPAFGLEAIVTQLGRMRAESLTVRQQADFGLRTGRNLPCPCIAEPKRGKNSEWGRLGAAIDDPQADRHVVRCGFRVFEEHIEVAAVVENAGIDEFVFRLQARAAGIFFDQLAVGKLGLRVFVESAHEGMRGVVVEVVKVILNVFAMVSLRVRQAEGALFEDGILAVPERGRKAQQAVFIRNTQQAILAPAIGT